MTFSDVEKTSVSGVSVTAHTNQFTATYNRINSQSLHDQSHEERLILINNSVCDYFGLSDNRFNGEF